MPPNVHTELAWAAGFFDGEGSFGVARRDRSFVLQLAQIDARPLERFREAVVTERPLNGPYDGRPDQRPQFRLRAYGHEAVRIMGLLCPYLAEPKREQYAAAHRLMEELRA